MSEENTDPELLAMQQVIKAVEPLSSDARTRVLAYLSQRLGLSVAAPNTTPPPSDMPPTHAIPAGLTVSMSAGATVADIRSLKEAKRPKAANQMAALVAYYLKEVAPASDRQDAISQEDIEKYFKQAGFPLPKTLRMTLPNAKNAGYFDSAGVGRYRLNPVGHNLVVHGMPSSLENDNSPPRRSKTEKTAE